MSAALLLMPSQQGQSAGQPAGYPYRQIVTRTANNTGWDDGIPNPHTGWTSRTWHYATTAGADPRLSFNNARSYGPGLVPLVIGAAIEVGGAIHPVTFGGQPRVTLQPGGSVTSDPVTGLSIPVGPLYIRTYQEVPTVNDKMPQAPSLTVGTRNNEGASKAAGTDLTLVGSGDPSLMNGRTHTALSLHAVVAEGAKPAFASVADSIGEGYGDSYDWGDPVTAGYFARALVPNNLPYINYSRGGDQAEFMTADRFDWWFEGLTTCTHAVCGIATNDIIKGRTAAQIQTDNIRLWKWIKSKGLTLVQHTCVPLTSSTDGWATVGNQTRQSTAPVLDAWNAWLRDGAPITSGGVASATGSSGAGIVRAGDQGHPLAAILDLAATVETSLGSGIWGVGAGRLTIDGIHPSPEGHALMAAPLATWATSVTA